MSFPGSRRRRLKQAATARPPATFYEVAYASPARQAAAPVTALDEDAAVTAARRLSADGDVVDIMLVKDGVTRSPVASYAGGRLLLGSAARVPAAADAALAPVTRLRGTGDARQFPQGIRPLLVAATSGDPLRPRRLLHPGSPLEHGVLLDCQPADRAVPPWTGAAVGVVPAAGDLAPGWLQVVRPSGAGQPGDLVTMHPALISPHGLDPYACLPVRQRRRFGEFDAAEAVGWRTAWLPATLVDPGDFISAQDGDILHVSDVDHGGAGSGEYVRVLADDLGGDTASKTFGHNELTEIMIPASHPAEDGPQAWRLFAPRQMARVLRAPRSVQRDSGR